MKTISHTGKLGKYRANSSHPQNDLRDLLARVTPDDLRSLIESYGGTRKGAGKAYRCVLPTHADSTPSLHVFARATWKCFGCGAGGDYLDLVEAVENLNKREAIERLRNKLGGYVTASRAITRPAKTQPKESERTVAAVRDDLSRLGETEGRELLERYLAARGWPSSVVERFGLAAVSYKGPRVLHPLHGYVNGKLELVSWQLRLDLNLEATDERPKWWSRAGSPLTFYGIEALERDDLVGVVLVEGPADYVTATLALESVGASHWVALGIIGAKNFAGLEPLIRGLSVVVAFDNDENGTGDKAAADLVEVLGRAVIRVRPDAFDHDLTEAAKRLGLETVGEWLHRTNDHEPPTSRGPLDETSFVAFVLAEFSGSYLLEAVAS